MRNSYLKEKSDKLKKFEKIQWRIADIEHYGRELWKAKRFIFTAEENGQIVGFVGLEIAAGVCHIYSFNSSLQLSLNDYVIKILINELQIEVF